MRTSGGFSLGPVVMKYTKPALSLDAHIELMASRGLKIEDKDEARHYLTYIGYYRLSGYMRALQIEEGRQDHKFADATTFDDVLDLYVFDRKLRLLVLDAIERIEVSMRTVISDHMAYNYGAHWYLSPEHFKEDFKHDEFLETVRREIGYDDKPRDIYISHYRNVYSDPELPPGWMVFEALSFGKVSKLFTYLKTEDKRNIASAFKLKHPFFKSWVHTLASLRNICAHHGRVWNRVFGVKPSRPTAMKKNIPQSNRFYAQAVIIMDLLNTIAPHSEWGHRLQDLMQEHPKVDIARMGFPENWHEHSIWGMT